MCKINNKFKQFSSLFFFINKTIIYNLLREKRSEIKWMLHRFTNIYLYSDKTGTVWSGCPSSDFNLARIHMPPSRRVLPLSGCDYSLFEKVDVPVVIRSAFSLNLVKVRTTSVTSASVNNTINKMPIINQPFVLWWAEYSGYFFDNRFGGKVHNSAVSCSSGKILRLIWTSPLISDMINTFNVVHGGTAYEQGKRI